MIELKNITRTFNKKKTSITALSGVSHFILKGKITGVIGESGAGKSTLIRCVKLLEKPDSGDVIVDGQNPVTLSSSALIRQIGMIINSNFSALVGLMANKDGLFVEDKDSPYMNLIVPREDNKDKEKVKNFVKAFRSPEVAKAAEDEFYGSADLSPFNISRSSLKK